jgi:DUF2889 family protein
MTIKFFRNKLVEVEPLSPTELVVSWRLTDDLLKLDVTLKVQIPEMEILEADAEVGRMPPENCKDAAEKIKMIEGITIGGGLRKIVRGILGGEDGCSLLVDAVLESANAVILHFTRPGIQIMESLTDPQQRLEGFQAMLKSNPKLVRSCISFQDDSPLMKGLNL